MVPDVIALGSVMVEISPTEAGVPLAQVRTLTALPGGAACNFAAALARLGVRVSLATAVGDDEWGTWVRARLTDLGIDTSRVRTVTGQLTTVSFCWADRLGGKRFYFYRVPGHSDPIMALTAEDVMAETRAENSENSDSHHFPASENGDCHYFPRFFDLSEAAIRKPPLRDVALESARRARAAGLGVCYAVNYRPASWSEPEGKIRAVQRQALALADVAVMNRDEAQFLSGESDIRAALEALSSLGPQVIAVTAGDQGTWVLSEGQPTHLPARPVEVLYDVGAGDVFHAGLLAGLIQGRTPVQAAQFGSDAAAIWISRPADFSGLPTREEVEALPDL